MSYSNYFNEITPIISKASLEFGFIKKDTFDKLCNAVKEKFDKEDIGGLGEYKLSFERELKRVLNVESQKLFCNPKTMENSINTCINLNFKVGNSCEDNFNILSRFCNFLYKIRFFPDADALMVILQNNTIKQLIRDVVDNNIKILNSNGISSITSNPVFEIILETYCESINLDLGNNGLEYSDDSYKRVSTIEIPNLPTLTKEEEKNLLQLAKDGDKKAREKIILHNLKLVSKIASHSKSKRIPFEDLFQQGYFGLEEAINRFDLTTDYRFSTYATCWIRQKITKYVCDNDRTIRLPVHIIGEVIPKIDKIQSQLYEVLGREPSFEELYVEVNKIFNMSKNRFLEIYRGRNEPASLDFKIGDNEDTELYNFVGIEDLSGEDRVFNEQLRSAFYSIFDEMNRSGRLSNREREIIILRFGLGNQNPMTLESLGLMFNVTRERIRQIEHKVLKRLENPKYKKYLLPFIKYYEIVDSSPVAYNNSFIPNESFYEFFIRNGLTSEEIDMALNDMPGDFKYYLNSIFQEKNANRTIKDYFNHVIVPFMMNVNKDNLKEQRDIKLSGLCMKKRKITNIYSFFESEGYTEEQIDCVIRKWPETYCEIVKQGFGTDLKNPVLYPWVNQSQSRYFNNTIIPETRKMLEDETYVPSIARERKADKDYNERVETTKKENNNNTLEQPTSYFNMVPIPSFEVFLMNYSISDIVITSLCLGGVDGVAHSIESIIQFLKIDSNNFDYGKVQTILEEYKIECSKKIDSATSNRKDTPHDNLTVDSKKTDFSSFEEYLKTRSLIEISVVGLNLGYVTGFSIDSKSISQFLSLDNEHVISIIRNSLSKYKNEMDQEINGKIDSLKISKMLLAKNKIITNN